MDYAAITVALIAAAVSLVNLLLTTSLSEGRDRRKVLWERELSRFLELEDIAGQLVEELMTYQMREPSNMGKLNSRMGFLSAAAGRFLRYRGVTDAIRRLHHAAGWYIQRDMQHENRAEFEQARKDVTSAFGSLVEACDKALRSAPKRL